MFIENQTRTICMLLLGMEGMEPTAPPNTPGTALPSRFTSRYRVFIKYCLFSEFLKYSGLLPFSVFSLCQCVYTHQAGRTPALQQNWQSSEKSQNFKEKSHYLMNILYLRLHKIDKRGTLIYLNVINV